MWVCIYFIPSFHHSSDPRLLPALAFFFFAPYMYAFEHRRVGFVLILMQLLYSTLTHTHTHTHSEGNVSAHTYLGVWQKGSIFFVFVLFCLSLLHCIYMHIICIDIFSIWFSFAFWHVSFSCRNGKSSVLFRHWFGLKWIMRNNTIMYFKYTYCFFFRTFSNHETVSILWGLFYSWPSCHDTNANSKLFGCTLCLCEFVYTKLRNIYAPDHNRLFFSLFIGLFHLFWDTITYTIHNDFRKVFTIFFLFNGIPSRSLYLFNHFEVYFGNSIRQQII